MKPSSAPPPTCPESGLGTALFAAILVLWGVRSAGASPPIPRALRAPLDRMPLFFVENRGQADPRVGYYLQGIDKTLFFTSRGVTFALRGHPRWTIALDLVGASPRVAPRGEDPTPAVVSYFHGSPDRWRTALPTFSTLRYESVWPGIDLVYSGDVHRLEYRFVVRPGADPRAIRLAYRGATSLAVDAGGRMVVSWPGGGFTDDVPVAWQETPEGRKPVSVAYELARPSRATGRRYGFRVGAYDPRLPLVIDPTVIVYCGYIGGSGSDQANGIAVDGHGYAYVVGSTVSNQATFPVAVGPDLTENDQCCFAPGDAFVAKVRADGTALVYCGYIGGVNTDAGNAVAVDASGNAYVTGTAHGEDGSFPALNFPYLSPSGGDDVFVSEVNASGTALLYSGFLGGSQSEQGDAIAVDDTGAAYVTGQTGSCNGCWPAGFPLVNPLDGTFNGNGDAFLTKIAPAGAAIVYSTFLGGAGYDQGSGIAVDAQHNVYVAGETASDPASFPVVGGPSTTYGGGLRDAFVMKINASGSAIVWSGYIGGAGTDRAFALGLGPDGSVYVTGQTDSSESTFPVEVGPSLTYHGSDDGFIAKVKPDGSGLTYCGYLGGSGNDWGSGVAVDRYGRAHVAGGSASVDWPAIEGRARTNVGGSDPFVTRVSQDGTALEYLAFIGGDAGDQANGIALDGDGNAYIAGVTSASQATFPVAVGPDLTYNDVGYSDAFVAKVAPGTVTITFVADGHMTWGPLDGATGYDVVYGDLMALRSTSDFAQAVEGCVADGFPGTDLVYPPDPCAPGGGLFYLARDGRACTPSACKGTYGDGSPTQVGPRDPGIDAAALACP